MLKMIKNMILKACLRSTYKSATLVSAIIISTSGPAFAADFEAGLDAFRAGNAELALEEWQPLAEAGEPNAQHALGMMYEYGHAVERDDVEAAKWYEKAAEQNMSEAQYRLGVFYDNGWGVPRDAVLAVK